MGKFNIDLSNLPDFSKLKDMDFSNFSGSPVAQAPQAPPPEADALRKFIQNPETGAIERNVPEGGYAGPTPIAAANPAHFAANPFSQKSASFSDVLRGLGNRQTSLGKEVYGPNTHSVYPNSGGSQNG